MKFVKLKTLSGLLLAGSAVFVGSASAAIVDFTNMAAATYGHANETQGTFTGGCPNNNCFLQNGIVAGTAGDPLDGGSHFHRQGTTADREAQYHPDSSGMYVRMADLSNFSLQSIDLNVTNGATGGNYVLYGYANALNPGLLTSNVGAPLANGKLNPLDPEGGTVAPIASYVLPNDGVFNGTLSLATLTAADSDWGNIGAFWLTFQGFNHSPTVSYTDGTYPDWDIRVDNINLGAAIPPVSNVPLPGAVWLFGSALAGFVARRKKATV